jgi:hypothetical protein
MILKGILIFLAVVLDRRCRNDGRRRATITRINPDTVV